MIMLRIDSQNTMCLTLICDLILLLFSQLLCENRRAMKTHTKKDDFCLFVQSFIAKATLLRSCQAEHKVEGITLSYR